MKTYRKNFIVTEEEDYALKFYCLNHNISMTSLFRKNVIEPAKKEMQEKLKLEKNEI